MEEWEPREYRGGEGIALPATVNQNQNQNQNQPPEMIVKNMEDFMEPSFHSFFCGVRNCLNSRV